MKALVSAAVLAAALGTSLAAPVQKTAGKKDKAVAQIDQQIENAKVDKSNPKWRTALPKPQLATFEPGRTYYARVQTSKGPLKIKFLPDVAPMHVTNFIYLSRLGFFDGLSFHRVIPGFMAQGGCPFGTGMGDPGYRFEGEFSPKVRHERAGLLSMANRGPGTDGSQFFLTFVPTPFLDNKHTIFGEVVEGMDTLKKLEAAGSQSGRTSELLRMEKVSVEVE